METQLKALLDDYNNFKSEYGYGLMKSFRVKIDTMINRNVPREKQLPLLEELERQINNSNDSDLIKELAMDIIDKAIEDNVAVGLK
jgi:hypothetical protein